MCEINIGRMGMRRSYRGRDESDKNRKKWNDDGNGKVEIESAQMGPDIPKAYSQDFA